MMRFFSTKKNENKKEIQIVTTENQLEDGQSAASELQQPTISLETVKEAIDNARNILFQLAQFSDVDKQAEKQGILNDLRDYSTRIQDILEDLNNRNQNRALAEKMKKSIDTALRKHKEAIKGYEIGENSSLAGTIIVPTITYVVVEALSITAGVLTITAANAREDAANSAASSSSTSVNQKNLDSAEDLTKAGIINLVQAIAVPFVASMASLLTYRYITKKSDNFTYEKNVVDAWDGLAKELLGSIQEMEKTKSDAETLAENARLRGQIDEQDVLITQKQDDIDNLQNRIKKLEEQVEIQQLSLVSKQEEIDSLQKLLPTTSSSNSYN